MTAQTSMSAGDLYQQVVTAFVTDPSIEAALLADFDGTIEKRFGVSMPKSGTLMRTGSGFRLSYDGKDYDLGDPRTAAKGELNDAELELVSAGNAEEDCKKAGWDKPFG